jgi:hypothetical protein
MICAVRRNDDQETLRVPRGPKALGSYTRSLQGSAKEQVPPSAPAVLTQPINFAISTVGWVVAEICQH